MLLAVHDLHELQIAHGDVKLENFVVNRGGVVKLADFGLSGGGVGMRGTRRYMAPECLRGEGGLQADVWALAVCWFVLACGRWPFGGARDAARLFREIREMEPVWETVADEGLRSLLQNMLVKNEWDRFDVRQVMKHEWFADVDWQALREDAKVHGFDAVVEAMRGVGAVTDDEESDLVAENAVSDVSAEEVFDGCGGNSGASKKAWSVAEVRRRLSGERGGCGALGAALGAESIAAFSMVVS
ncbi:Aurora kinase A [Gracilaria domingensis]|nr:Aurora kinase A [Gracilaria domingensis]